MALPKIDKPLFDIELPILNQKGKFRPYQVKEEKILLLAQQSEEFDQIVLATKQIITNCMQEGDIDIDKLPSWAIEWILLQLRIRSVGESVKAKFRDKEDQEVYEFDIPLDEIKLTVDPEHTNSFNITEDIGLVMDYPTLEMAQFFIADDTNSSVNAIRSCIKQVFTDDEVMEFQNHDEEEQIDFVEQLGQKEMAKVINFFDTAPKVKYTIDYTNSKGTKRVLELNTLTDFFT